MTRLLFNAVTVNLTKNANSTNEFDEYRYNRPNDFLSMIRYSDNMRIEGEFIYSTYREIRALRIYETSDVQKVVIARSVLGAG